MRYGGMNVVNVPIQRRSASIIERDAAEPSYIVRGYATTYEPYVLFYDGDIPYYEKIDKKAFEGVNLSDVCFLLNHEGVVLARPRNNTLKLTVDEHGLYVEADLSSTQQARDVYDAISSGLIYQMSFAFTTAEEEYDAKKHFRTIKKFKKIFDVSAVNIPANPTTIISAEERKKFLEEIRKQEELELKKRKVLLLNEINKGKSLDYLKLAKAKFDYLK